MKIASALCLIALLTPLSGRPAEESDPVKAAEQVAARQIRDLGGVAFLDLKSGRITEVNWNGNEKLRTGDLALVARLPEITDLSLERTAAGDKGVAHLVDLTKLQWLNLYRTQLTDSGLKSIGMITSLTHLPIGETKVTDAGLVHLATLPKLEYLGLRGNRISDEGVKVLMRMKSLTSLHLRGTEVTDAAVESLVQLPKLSELWLSDTEITDAGLKRLAAMKSLKRLHLQRTRTTAGAIKALRMQRPDCEIFWESDPK